MPSIELGGVAYHYDRQGSGSPIVLLHGFTGNLETWAPRLPVITERYETIAIDQLGHGCTDAPADPDRYRAERAVADLIRLLDRLEIPEAIWLGYSMGARLALQVAVNHPARVSALILESGSPGIAEPEERVARTRTDAKLADRIEREGIVAFVDFWERLPMFSSHDRLPADVRERQRAQRLQNDPIGLANSLRGFGQGIQPAVNDRLKELTMPVCLIAGEEDTKYVRLAKEIAAAIPCAGLNIVSGVGHTPHLERPETFDHIVLDFLNRIDSAIEKETSQ
jgi:2-succinyl-6-hydroxy-2,4-cyclohexadiene-1-carboxylate synthase